MTIPPSAAIVLLLCIGLLSAAWVSARGRRTAAALVAIVITAGLVRAYAAREHRLHEWDERYHAVVAKHLAQHPLTPTLYDDPVLPYDYHDWMSNHVWLHKPPLALWMMAASLRVFGREEWAVRVPSVVLSTLSVFLTFAIGVRLFDARVALLASAFQAVNGLLVALVSGRAPNEHVDTTLIVVFELAVYVALLEVDTDRWSARVALGASIGLGLLAKWYPALLVLPIWWWRAGGTRSIARLARDTAGVVLVAVAVAAPWAWHIARAFPREAMWEWRYALAHASEELEGHRASALWYVIEMPKFFGELVFIPLAFAIATAVRTKQPALRFVLVWIAVPYGLFSFAATQGSAYVLVAAPAVFLVEAWFWLWLANASALRARSVLRIALLATFTILPARYLLRPGGPFTIVDERPPWLQNITAVDVHRLPPRTVLFNVAHPIETMFYLPCPAYPRMPTPDEARDLTMRGYTPMVFDETTGTVRPL